MALRHHLPRATVDAVEMDPETLDMAACFFGAKQDAHLSLLCEDGLSFLTHPGSRRMVRVAPEHLLRYYSEQSSPGLLHGDHVSPMFWTYVYFACMSSLV